MCKHAELIFLAGAVAAGLSACNPFAAFKPDSDRILSRPWAKQPPQPAPAPLYCYRTLGERVCYRQELARQEERLACGSDHEHILPCTGEPETSPLKKS